MSESLYKKTVSGIGWNFIDSIVSYLMGFVISIILARLLSPKEYGLIGIVMIFINVFSSIVDSGFTNALIRKNNATKADYNTVFIYNMVFSIFLFVVLYFSAPAISSFFKQPELISLTRVMGFILIINAFTLIQQTILTKNLDFKTQTKIKIIASVVSGVIGIVMAFCGFGVWSLVGHHISRQFLTSILLWIRNKWRPALEFSVNSFKELFGFGWKILASGLLNTVWNQVYQIVIGRFYDAENLGYYTRATGFTNMFSTNITTIVHKISYPVLSKIQDDKEHLKAGYKRIIKTTMLVSFVCMFGLAAASQNIIFVLIGEKWLPCVVFIQIICFSEVLYPLHAINLNMLQVQGRSDLFLKLEIIKKIVAVGPILIGIFINIYWMLIGSVIAGFIYLILNSYYSGKFLNYSIKEQLLDISPSIGIALSMAIVVYGISFIPVTPYILLPIQLIVGVSMTIGLCELFKKEEYFECKNIVMSFVKKLRHGK